jgi:hypothetical protein
VLNPTVPNTTGADPPATSPTWGPESICASAIWNVAAPDTCTRPRRSALPIVTLEPASPDASIETLAFDAWAIVRVSPLKIPFEIATTGGAPVPASACRTIRSRPLISERRGPSTPELSITMTASVADPPYSVVL